MKKANNDLPQRWQERISLFPQFLFLRNCRSDRKFYFSITFLSDFASTQRIRSIIASKVARRARGEGAPLSPTSTNDRANLCDRDFYRRHSGIDFSGNGCQVGETYTSRSKLRAIMKRDLKSILMKKEV